MKANELMIGDWVVGGSGEPFKIGIIEPGFLYWDEVQPIPLTPEILEKNGFIEDGERHWTLSDEYTGDDVIGLYEVANGFTMPTSCLAIGLQNVHELQHLFRLCGIKKDIVL